VETVAHLDTLGMRERILEMATRLIVARGYDGISMREIADACGMSKAGLYYHFKDKEDLFLAILSGNLDELAVILNEIEAQAGTVREKFTQFVLAVFTRLPVEHRAMIRLAGQEMDKIRPELRAAFGLRYQEQFIGRLAALYAQGIRAGELRDMNPALGVWGLLGLMYPFFNPWHSGSEGARHPESASAVDPIIDFIVSMYFDGVARHG
jgi:AcrR family transcriptional regulator